MWALAAIVLGIGRWDQLVDPWFLASIPFHVAATVLLIKAPGNAIGWMIMGFPATTTVAVLGRAIAVQAGSATSLAAWADTIGNGFATASIMFLPSCSSTSPMACFPRPAGVSVAGSSGPERPSAFSPLSSTGAGAGTPR